MKNLKTYLCALTFSLAGVAVHANAASENQRGDSGICFQLTPLAGKGALPSLTENGFSRTPQGMKTQDVAFYGFDRTPQEQQLEHLAEDGSSRTMQGMKTQAVAANGFERTPLGHRFERLAEDGSSRTPQGMKAQLVAENGFERTLLGERFEAYTVVDHA